MKYITTLALVFLFHAAAFTQVGINASYRTNDAPDWQYTGSSQIAQELLPESTIAIGLDYWIPLKTYRIDFVPEINFQRMGNDILVGRADGPMQAELSNTWISFFLNTNIYFLDLEGDCDCPTFSKSGGPIQKGLFLQLSPGFSYMKNKMELADGLIADSDDTAFSAAVALGLDIGLSSQLTITPMAGMRYYFSAGWESLSSLAFPDDAPDIRGITSESSDVRQFYAGLKLGLRLDQ